MKKMSKTLLSMALAIAMVFSLMPMSFAVEGEAASEKSGVYVEYDIMSHFVASTPIATILTSEKTNGFLGFEGTSAASVWYHANSYCVQLTTGNWLIFKINVPVAGKYDIKIKNYLGNSGGDLKAYIFPTDETPDADALSSDNYIGSVNCSSRVATNTNNGATSGTPNPFVKDGVNASYTFSTAGEYYMGFKAENGTGFVGNIVLDGGSGYALIGDMTIEPESVGVGEHAQAIATAYRSDYAREVKKGNNAVATEVTAFTYDSSNKDVATVDSEGNITTLMAGKTTITATAEGAANSISRELEVTAAKSGITVMYDIMSHKANGSGSLYQRLSYETTNGFFTYATASSTSFGYHQTTTCIQIPAGHWIIFKINVPAAGTYDVKIKNHVGNTGGNLNAYIFSGNAKPDEKALSDSNFIGSVDCSSYTGTDGKNNPNPFVKDGVNASYNFPTTGEYYIGFKPVDDGKTGFVGDIVLDGGIGNALMGLNEKEIAIGTTDTIKAYLSSTAAELTENVTYESDNSDVAKVENGKIKAVGYGDANITVTYSGDDVISGMSSFTTKVSVKDAKTSFVSIGIDEDGDGIPTITSATLGSKMTVEAADLSEKNMVFRGWVRGSTDDGHLVWTEPKYTFTATTHTYLTAIYTPVNAAATNEYYHWNGEFLGNTQPATVSPIVGYTFAESWTKAKEENAITSWIADFTKNNDEYAVTGNGFTMTKDDNKYDTEVTCTSDNGAVYWYRDGKLVDYGTEYKFFIWDKTEITTSNEGHNGAKLMLDAKKGNSYMVEYDAGNATLLEVGILFGEEGEVPTVESCQEKMSSQRNLNEAGHGQFSATSEYPVARGYLVYKDGNTYRVIYAN